MRWPLCQNRHRHHHPASNERNLSLPWGRWETLNMSTHIVSSIPTDQGRRYRDRARIDVDTTSLQTTSNFVSFPWGRWELSNMSVHTFATVFPLMVLDEMVTEGERSVFPQMVQPPTLTPPPCKQRAKREFPMGAMGTFQGMRHVHTVVDRSVRSCASVSRGKRVSNSPIGAMGTFEVSG